MLEKEEKAYLIAVAHEAARKTLGLKGRELGPVPEALKEPGACFVTWKRDGRLRGCIGSLEPVRPLVEDAGVNAVYALVKDPRFPPATARDYPRYRVSISVLSPREPIGGPSDVEIGRHGLYVEKGMRSGLLLPQVAPEWGWDAEKFLEQACLKAGLSADAWFSEKGRASLFRFEAEVFGEE